VVVEPETGIVTDAALTPASGADNSDAAVGIDLLAGQNEPVEVLGDSAYGTGDMLEAAERAGHTPVIKPWPLRPAVEGGVSHERCKPRVDQDRPQ
jgi:hypothetical protein